MEHYSAEQTRTALPADQLIDRIRHYFIEGCHVPLRHNHAIHDSDEQFLGSLLLMPAWQAEKWMGVKTVSVFPKNSEHDLAGLHSMYILYDAKTGVPVATLDGDTITSRRTAAASALAADYLARQDSEHLLIVGAGKVGQLVCEMYRAVRDIKQVSIYNLTHDKAQALAESLNTQFAGKLHASAVSELEPAVRAADIISCATLSTEPLILREWLKAGQHLDLIGSFAPNMRETDGGCFSGTEVFIDTEEALMKAGDILSAIDEGCFVASDVQATLSALCQGKHSGRSSDEAITVFKSVGTGLEDLAAASLAYEKLGKPN